jgi:hypothetical protein
MPPIENRPVVVLTKRGSGVVIPLSRAWLSKLGWNRNDHVVLSTQDGVLIVRKIELPKAPDLRVKAEARETAK